MRAFRTLLGTALIVGGVLAVIRLSPVHPGTRIWNEPTPASAAAPAYTSDEQNNIEVYKASHEATVNITSVVYRQGWFMDVYPEKGAGSGFIINSDGEILTNNHVVNGSAQLTVTLSNKKSYKAKILGIDEGHDLALIKIDAGAKLTALHLGDSDGLVVGQKVLAIGNPFGQFGGTLTTGVVSSLDRSIQTENEQLEGMIQTDAAINPGNSGGPLLNSHGDVIGINTAIYGPQGNIGIGFAMPINRAKTMLDEFAHSGHISQPTLGITTVYISEDLAQMLDLPRKGGLLIQQVERGSPAQEAGLRGPSRVVLVWNYRLGVGGDLIQEIDGEPVDNNQLLQRVMNRKRGGDMVTFGVWRDGRIQKIQVKLGSAPQKM